MRSKMFWCAAAGLAVLAGLMVTVRADEEDHTPSPTTRPARMQQGGEGALHRGMEDMGRAFKQLQTQVADPGKNESSLALLAQMQTLTVAGKTDVPRLVQRMPATQQADKTNDFRIMMVDLLKL